MRTRQREQSKVVVGVELLRADGILVVAFLSGFSIFRFIYLKIYFIIYGFSGCKHVALMLFEFYMLVFTIIFLFLLKYL